MAFHRLAVPSYFGGLPGGYDYINNALTGTPAMADGPKAVGPNVGTYFVAFGEDGTSNNFNRSNKALAENTDFLDNLLRRDIALASITSVVTASGPVSSITLTGPGVFLGAPGTPNTPAGINTFIEILDANDHEIVDASGTRCMVTSITGGTVGSGGFSTGNVVCTVIPAIPDTTQYHVYYGVRSNLATMPVDALTNIKIRSAQEVPADLEGPGGAALIGYAAGPTWADGTTNPQSHVQTQLDKIINDLSAATGTEKLGGRVTAGSPYSLSAARLDLQIASILGSLNTENASMLAAVAALLATVSTQLTLKSITFNGPGSWIVPQKCLLAIAIGCGGGGGGASGTTPSTGSNFSAPGGGAGGGALKAFHLLSGLTPGGTVTIAGGLGGSGGVHGGSGQDGDDGQEVDITVGATVYTFFGGQGGSHSAATYGTTGNFAVSCGGGNVGVSPRGGAYVFAFGSITGIHEFPHTGEGFGGSGGGGNGNPGGLGAASREGHLGGAGGALGALSGSVFGGGGGGGGGAGPFGDGGAGGHGGDGNNSGTGGTAGVATAAADNTGAGGGGGGGGGFGSSAPGVASDGAAGGSGKVTIVYISIA